MGRRIGEMACTNPFCNCQDMAVEVTNAGAWQAKCHKCQKPTYGKPGTPWRRAMEKLIKLDPEEEQAEPAAKPTPATKPEPTDPPAPTKRPASSVFDLANLK